MPIDPRLEATFTLGEREITLRPTFATLVAVEKAAGRPILAFMQDVGASVNVTMEEFVVVAVAAFKANGTNLKVAEVGEALLEYGYTKFTMEFCTFLLTGFQGPSSLPQPNAEEAAAEGEQ